ncbi:MAG: DegV family protein [Anaerolineae bacterium]|nr:DegV family protein [Anaerolineae bacterium]
MIAVVTESVADLPPALVQEWGIPTVPYVVTWDGNTYRDGVDLDPSELYRAMRTPDTSVSTGFPSAAAFEELYQKAGEGADGVLSVHISGDLSGGYAQAAQVASRMASALPIRALDSRTVSMAQGYVALAAARAASLGRSLEEVVRAAEKARDEVFFVAAFDTLEYLFRGGRLKRSAYLLGSALRIKPIIAAVDGKLQPIGRARNLSQAIRRIADMVAERAKGTTLHFTAMHSDNLEGAHQLLESVTARVKPVDGYVNQITPALGAHGGPGLVAACIWAETG